MASQNNIRNTYKQHKNITLIPTSKKNNSPPKPLSSKRFPMFQATRRQLRAARVQDPHCFGGAPGRAEVCAQGLGSQRSKARLHRFWKGFQKSQKNDYGNCASFCEQSVYIEISIFPSLHLLTNISTFSSLFYWNLYFTLHLSLKSLLSLRFSLTFLLSFPTNHYPF